MTKTNGWYVADPAPETVFTRHPRTGAAVLSLTCICGKPCDGQNALGLCHPCYDRRTP